MTDINNTIELNFILKTISFFALGRYYIMPFKHHSMIVLALCITSARFDISPGIRPDRPLPPFLFVSCSYTLIENVSLSSVNAVG